jgi:DNA-directed RNA polymerase specialized sigma24 family protein
VSQGNPADDRSDGSLPPESSHHGAPAVAQAVPSIPPPRESGVDLIKDAVVRFLASRREDEGDAFIRGVVIAKLYPTADDRKQADEALVDDLTQRAGLKALEIRWPPWTLAGVRGWVKRLTHRTVFAYFREKKREEKYIARDVDPADLSGSQAFPKTDYGARAHLIYKYMARLIGDDPVKVKTLRLMYLRDEGHSIEELARENGMTPGALSLRIHKLRKELAPKISIMDDEKKRLMILVGFWGGGPLLVIAIALWLWLHPSPQPPAPPAPRPVPTASASPAPTLDIARDTPARAAPDAATVDTTPDAAPRPRPRPPRAVPPPVSGEAGAGGEQNPEDMKRAPR